MRNTARREASERFGPERWGVRLWNHSTSPVRILIGSHVNARSADGERQPSPSSTISSLCAPDTTSRQPFSMVQSSIAIMHVT